MNFVAGVNPIVVFIAIPAVLMIAWYIVIVPSWRNRNAKAVIGHLLCEFCTLSGNSYEVLCKEERGEVVKDSNKENASPSDTIIKNPNKTEIGHYFTLPDFCFNTLYPRNMPKAVQVTVKKSYYLENDPMPQIAFNPEKWNPEKFAFVSAQMIAMAQDDATMKAQNELDKEIFKDIHSVATIVKVLPWMKILIYVGIAVGLLTLWLVYQIGMLM